MNLTAPRRLQRMAHQVGAAISEMNYAQRRMFCLMTAYDWYAPAPDDQPEHYAEFLLRTSGVLRYEPSARQRGAGRPIR